MIRLVPLETKKEFEELQEFENRSQESGARIQEARSEKYAEFRLFLFEKGSSRC
jgi:hypothetical protein